MLTEYFAANVIYGEASPGIKYEDFPVKFVWRDKEKCGLRDVMKK